MDNLEGASRANRYVLAFDTANEMLVVCAGRLLPGGKRVEMVSSVEVACLLYTSRC